MSSPIRVPSLLAAALGSLVLWCLSVRGAVVQEIVLEGIPAGLSRSGIEQLVLSTIQVKKNDQLDTALLSKDLENLYRTGHFEDIRTRLEAVSPSLVRLVYVLKVKVPVGAVRFEGNHFIEDGKLAKEVGHALGILPDDAQIAKDRKALEDKYRNRGYYGTAVESRIVQEEGQATSTLLFVVREAPRHKLKGVAFEGNTCFGRRELAAALATRRQWWRYILRFGNYFNQEGLTLDRRNLKQLYDRHGRLDFAVRDVTYEYSRDRTWVTPTYHLYEGPQYRVGRVKVTGAAVFQPGELLGDDLLKPGAVFDTEAERGQADHIRNRYASLGYLDLTVHPRRTVDHAAHTVDVDYRIHEGGPVRVGRVYIVGNKVTQEKVIRRELEIHDGDLADVNKIDVSRQRLRNLEYFSSVDILTVATPSPDIKDLRIELTEKKTGSLGLGAGFSSEDSVMGYLEFTETNYDVSRILDWPQRGGGQRLRAYLGAGSEMVNFSLSLYEPAFRDSDVSFNGELFVNTRFEDEYDQRNAGASFMFGIPLSFQLKGFDHKEYWNLGLGMTLEQVRISDVDVEPLPAGVTSRQFGYRLVDEEDSKIANRLTMRLTRNTLDRPRFPTRGSKVYLETGLVTAALGSYSNYAQFSLGGEKFFPVYKDLVLKTSLDFSSASHLGGDDIAIFDRYFGGGYGTIRGFKRRDVAPTVREVNRNSSDDSPAGGLSMLMGTLELIAPVKDYMYCSVFTDMGNVWWDEFECRPGDLNWSVGIGCQFKVLPVRLDYAYPVSTSGDHLDGRGGRFHFNLQFTY